MLATDRDSLLCDLAETYGIYDLEALPVRTLAVLSFGLRDNSRIKMKLAGMETDFDRLILAGCFDALSWIRWSKTKDAQEGGTPPKSIYKILCGLDHSDNEPMGFRTPEEFLAAREGIIKEAQNGHRTG